ncbi:hypothetical protein N7478_012479 [Penicillium angulare]|uniref:uncharacterized protein n=1 Tax=Penicillium angulare TaxID=116970 RepID=UPI00253F83B4|nr:uncharacterized protein N7478_012479 [Penicillium angulare]KAJ5259498.1 hypothetical protein N7478_012479 [Penicillium angulare]
MDNSKNEKPTRGGLSASQHHTGNMVLSRPEKASRIKANAILLDHTSPSDGKKSRQGSIMTFTICLK